MVRIEIILYVRVLYRESLSIQMEYLFQNNHFISSIRSPWAPGSISSYYIMLCAKFRIAFLKVYHWVQSLFSIGPSLSLSYFTLYGNVSLFWS